MFKKISGAKTFLIRVPYFKRDWQVAFRKELGMYYFSDNDHKIEHTIEELKNELTKVNLSMKETKQFGERFGQNANMKFKNYEMISLLFHVLIVEKL